MSCALNASAGSPSSAPTNAAVASLPSRLSARNIVRRTNGPILHGARSKRSNASRTSLTSSGLDVLKIALPSGESWGFPFTAGRQTSLQRGIIRTMGAARDAGQISR
jgi:hypothetical protein